MKKIKFSRDEKRKIINYIQKVLNIKILSPSRHSTEKCDEDIKQIFQECYKNNPNTYISSKEKKSEVNNDRVEELEKLVVSKNIDNDFLKKEVLKLSKENIKLKDKLKHHKRFFIF